MPATEWEKLKAAVRSLSRGRLEAAIAGDYDAVRKLGARMDKRIDDFVAKHPTMAGSVDALVLVENDKIRRYAAAYTLEELEKVDRGWHKVPERHDGEWVFTCHECGEVADTDVGVCEHHPVF